MGFEEFPELFFAWKEKKDLNESLLSEAEKSIVQEISHPGRKLEFTLGRQALKEALIKAGAAPGLSIPRGEKGEPILPAGYSGSVSHTYETAIGVAGTKYKSVGVDIESEGRILDEKTYDKLGNEKEICWLRECDSNKRAIMLVSAKEAFFKMLYPQCKVYFGMRDAEFTWDGGGFNVKLLKNLGNLTYTDSFVRIFFDRGFVVSVSTSGKEC